MTNTKVIRQLQSIKNILNNQVPEDDTKMARNTTLAVAIGGVINNKQALKALLHTQFSVGGLEEEVLNVLTALKPMSDQNENSGWFNNALTAEIERLEAEQEAVKAMVNAYNEAIVQQDVKPAEKETKFIEELKKGLGINGDAPAGFDKAAKDCFTDLCRIHKNKGQGVDLEINDITPRTWGQATRDFLVMLLEIVLFPLGIARAAGSDAMVTNSSSKQSAVNYSTGFQKMVENQKAKPTENKQIQ